MATRGRKPGRSFAKERYEVTVRRAQVSDLMLMQWPHQKIADELKVSRQTVTRDVAIIEAGFRKAATIKVAELKGRQLAEIETIKKEYWQGWERSKDDRKVKSGKRTKADDGKSAPDVMTVREESQVGDPRFLDGVGKCLDRAADLVGLAPPKQLNLNDISKRPSDQLFNLIASRLPAFAQLLTGGSAAGRAGSAK